MDIFCGRGVGCLVFKRGIGQLCHRQCCPKKLNFRFFLCLHCCRDPPVIVEPPWSVSEAVTGEVAWEPLSLVFTQPPNRVNSYFGCLSPPHLQQGHLWCVQWLRISSINLLFQTFACWCYLRDGITIKLFECGNWPNHFPLPLKTSSQASKLH